MNNASANSANAAPAETMSWAALNLRKELAEADADMSWIGPELSQHHVESDEGGYPAHHDEYSNDDWEYYYRNWSQ